MTESSTKTIAEADKDLTNGITFEEEDSEPTIEVDPNDQERIIITLTTGKKYSADRYCPHAKVDLAYMGQVSEDDYPPEIGPVLMCTYHFWEFALDKDGRGTHASIHACPIEEGKPCPAKNKELDW